MTVKLVRNTATLQRLLQSVDGPVMHRMGEKAERVKVRAYQLCGVSDEEDAGPDSHLRDTIVKRIYEDANGACWLVGTDHPRARMHHDGTVPHDIDPVNGRFLVFNIGGVTIFTTHVDHPGTAPNPFLVNALPAARG